MSSGKNNSGAGSNKGRSINKQTFKAPTPGLEDVVFDYEGYGKPEDFKKFLNQLSQHVGVSFKYEAPTMAAAIRNLKEPNIEDPSDKEPSADVQTKSWLLKKYERECEAADKEKRAYKQNNQKCYNLFFCSF